MAERELLLAWWLLSRENSPELWLSTCGPAHTFPLFTGFLGTVCFSGCLGNQWSLPCLGVICCSNTAPGDEDPWAHTPHPENPSHAAEGAQMLDDKPPFPLLPAPAPPVSRLGAALRGPLCWFSSHAHGDGADTQEQR